MTLKIECWLQRDLSLFDYEIVDNGHADNRALDICGKWDKGSKGIHNPAPDRKDTYIYCSEPYKKLIVKFRKSALDDHAVNIRSDTLCTDVCESNHKKAEECESGSAECSEHVCRITLKYACLNKHGIRHDAACGYEERRNNTIWKWCSPITLALRFTQSRNYQSLGRPWECKSTAAFSRCHKTNKIRTFDMRLYCSNLRQRNTCETEYDNDTTYNK